MPFTFKIPVVTPSTANLREHPQARARRISRLRQTTHDFIPPVTLPALMRVHLVRCAPKALDAADNLPMALKGIVDELCVWWRVDDASPLFRFTYAQEKVPKGAECVRVECHLGAGAAAPPPHEPPPHDWPRQLEGTFEPVPTVEVDARKSQRDTLREVMAREASRPKPKGRAASSDAPAGKDWRTLVKPNVRKPE